MVDVDQDKVVEEDKEEEEEVVVMEVKVEVEVNLIPEVEEWVEEEADLVTETMEVIIYTYQESYWNHYHHFKDH